MKKLNLLVSSALVVMVFLPHQKTLGMEDLLTPTKTMASPSFLSSLQNVASNTVGWMRESALNGCDQFSRWAGSYAKDLPPVYFSKSFLEVDYAHDELFWQGHFYQELRDVKQAPFSGHQELAQLKDLQEIVWNGLLSPYVYEEELKTLEKKRLFSRVQGIRMLFNSELKENPDVALQSLRKDLINSLEEMQNNKKDTEVTLLTDLKKKLTYYRDIMNAFDYGETLASVCLGMVENKGKLALSETQYKGFMESLANALHKINKKQYFQIKAERESHQFTQDDTLQEQKLASTTAGDTDDLSKFLEEGDPNASFFSYPLSFVKGASNFVKQGISFTLENPLQAITMGLALQATAVAAQSSFALPQQPGNAKDRLRSRIVASSNSILKGEDREDAKFYNHLKQMRGSSNIIDLASLNATQGVIINGAASNDYSGWFVSSAGDFNGDGLNDIILGAPQANPQGRYSAGSSYVIYGQKGGYQTPIDLASLSHFQGAIINGAASVDYSGVSVSSAGDFNGDGLSDIIVGAPNASPQGHTAAGSSYIIYGQKGGYLSPIDLASLNASQGVIINGAAALDYSGTSVSSAGDFNGDGLSDVIVGTANGGRQGTGSSYVIYGQKGGYLSPIDLASLNASQGVIINGAPSDGSSGTSVSSAGDFNGDGLSDVIVGDLTASPQGRQAAGSSYVIYGQKGGYLSPIDLASLSPTHGVTINGAEANDYSGTSVSSAGDFNGDGLSDIMVGARNASLPGRKNAGRSYVIYGQKGGYQTPIDLAFLSPTQGFTINGAAAGHGSGHSVSSAGDFNGDGLNDVIVAAYASPQGRRGAGSSYIIYGQKGDYLTLIDLAFLNATQGFIINGAAPNDSSGWSVSSAGDFNGDGLNDVIVAAPPASPLGRRNAGSSYVIYGKSVVEKKIVHKKGQ